MLMKVGRKKDFIEKNTPVPPISGWMGDNLFKKKGMDIAYGKESSLRHHLRCVGQALPRPEARPARPCACPLRASTRSRASAMCWRAASSRVLPSRPRRWSSYPRPQRDQVRLPPTGFMHCSRSACRISKLNWKMGRRPGQEDGRSALLGVQREAQYSFQPQQPLVDFMMYVI